MLMSRASSRIRTRGTRRPWGREVPAGETRQKSGWPQSQLRLFVMWGDVRGASTHREGGTRNSTQEGGRRASIPRYGGTPDSTQGDRDIRASDHRCGVTKESAQVDGGKTASASRESSTTDSGEREDGTTGPGRRDGATIGGTTGSTRREGATRPSSHRERGLTETRASSHRKEV